MDAHKDYEKTSREVKALANSVENIALSGSSVFAGGKRRKSPKRSGSKSPKRSGSKSPKRSKSPRKRSGSKRSKSPKGESKSPRRKARRGKKSGSRKRTVKKTKTMAVDDAFANSLIKLGVQLKALSLEGGKKRKSAKKAKLSLA